MTEQLPAETSELLEQFKHRRHDDIGEDKRRIKFSNNYLQPKLLIKQLIIIKIVLFKYSLKCQKFYHIF